VTVDTAVYRRSDLASGHRLDGPAIVEERETTTVIRPDWVAEVLSDGSILASRRSAFAR
jgi:N-methylhydantoinase A/oxoprolinase/acetone carboxylase beta subunit